VNETSAHDLVLVVDFGAQYAQLIARRVREAKVYSEIVPHTLPVAEMLAKKPKAIILSGGPSSVYEEGAPSLNGDLFTGEVPVFGMCYGFQTMARALGGEVAATGLREYGRTPVTVIEPGTLLAGMPATHNIWMSHGDQVVLRRARRAVGHGRILSAAQTPEMHQGPAGEGGWPGPDRPRSAGQRLDRDPAFWEGA
jgi:GMP synthase (glutamine-hydrolysing)